MMEKLKEQARNILETNILPYWINKVTDHENGGYYGRIDGHDIVHPEADKGAILNARILWAFSAAYRVLHKPEYLKAATRARDYILQYFIDDQYGGVYWSLDFKGQPEDTKKQTYATGFAIYGLSEYARATGDEEAKAAAISLYHDIEKHAFDPVSKGYVEALTRDWKPIEDMRLSDKDENGSRTMNSHLHILEPYTNLYRIWKDPALKKSIRNLLDIFLNIFMNPEGHIDLFFDDHWEGKRNIQSFGHEIEASWLMHESALVLGDRNLLEVVEPAIRRIARASEEGLCKDGSLIYEHWTDTDRYDRQRQWWVECENVIGHINLYQHFGDHRALEVAERCFRYIQDHLIDNDHGEWYWAILGDGTVDRENDKAGFWKCPYHNSRMCLELMERAS
ncbi:MAG: AGE family epimerase/isomerase [Prevotella sp.]|jgi:mannobiose 2-epimerase|nr:AGE family epimerase/isomerase [Prevotella sp.]MCI2125383.1 AGE family epimerase/isomerase [Prevotella sp.]